MIKYLVCPMATRPERMNTALPVIGNPRGVDATLVPAEKCPEILKLGFSDAGAAQQYAEAAAAANPGVTYILYEAVRAVEIPAGPLQQKRFNDAGELVNA